MKFPGDGSSSCREYKNSCFQVSSDVSAFSAPGLYVLPLAAKPSDLAADGVAEVEDGTNRARAKPGLNEVMEPGRVRRPAFNHRGIRCKNLYKAMQIIFQLMDLC
jgi:hypothetical protein